MHGTVQIVNICANQTLHSYIYVNIIIYSTVIMCNTYLFLPRPLLHGGHLLNKFGFCRINTKITHLFVLCLLDINSLIISELPGTDILLQYIITVLYFERLSSSSSSIHCVIFSCQNNPQNPQCLLFKNINNIRVLHYY